MTSLHLLGELEDVVSQGAGAGELADIVDHRAGCWKGAQWSAVLARDHDVSQGQDVRRDAVETSQ